MKQLPRALNTIFTQRLTEFPIVALTGPRQSGKTTLVRNLLADWRYINLEDLDLRTYAQQDPRAFLRDFGTHTIIDEFQYAPELTSYLQTIVDEKGVLGQYVLTGSRSYQLHQQLSQSLAGRVGLLTLLPISHAELAGRRKSLSLDDWMWQGGFPPVIVHRRPADVWISSYLTLHVERDVRQLINLKDLIPFQRFLKLLAARVGQLLNYSSLARDCGVSQPTIKAWLSVLEAGYLVQRLNPWHSNATKRLVKSPKLFFLDTGILCQLLDIDSASDLRRHPLRGLIFENWVFLELLKAQFNAGRPPRLHFWREERGFEIDLVLAQASRLIPIEVKSGTTVQASFLKNLKAFEARQSAPLEGTEPSAEGQGNTAEGQGNTAEGQGNTAEGQGNTAKGQGYLVYGGTQAQARGALRIRPWYQVSGLLDEIYQPPTGSD